MQLKNFWVLTVVLVLLSLSDMKSIKKNELNITKEEIKKYETLIDIGISTTCDYNKIKSELHQLNLKDNKEVKQIEQQNQKKTKRRKYFSVNAKFYEELKNKNSIAIENTETSMVTSSII